MSTATLDEQRDYQRRQPRPTSNAGWWGALIGTLVVGLIGGLVAGIQIGKGGSTTTAGVMTGNNQQGGPGFGMRGGGIGTVMAVTSDSITIKNARQGTSTTYVITSTTTVTDNSSTASVSDIAVGDSVLVQTSSDSTSDSSSSDDSSTTKTATSIELNPTFPTGGPGTTQDSSSTSN